MSTTSTAARASRRDRRAFLAENPFPEPLTDGLFYREKMRAIHRCAPSGARRVLEIGGGRSGLATLLYPGADVTTIDIDRSVLGEGPGAQSASFLVGDGTALPFAAGSFDVVTLFDVIEHVENDQGVVAEARRVAAPGGTVLVTTPSDRWRYPHHRWFGRWCPPAQELMDEWGHVRVGYAPGDVETLFAQPAATTAPFINAATAAYHDISFSYLEGRRRRLAYAAAAPIALAGYGAHPLLRRGAEYAYRFDIA